MGAIRCPLSWLVLFIIITPGLPFVQGETKHLWTPTNGPKGGGFHIIKINPDNPDLMYIGSGYTFYRSMDGGDFWTRVEDLHIMSGTEELGVQAIVFDPFDPSIVYVGTRGGLFKSNDNGETWTRKTTERIAHSVNEIAIDPDDNDIVYIVTSFGGPEQYFYVSRNGGETWTELTTHLPDRYHLNSLIAVKHDELYIGIGDLENNNSYLYHSADGGQSWHIQDVGQGVDTHLSIIRVDPHNGDHIYIGFADKYNRGRTLPELLFESVDGGETWQPVRGGEIGSVVQDIVVSTSNPDLIYYQSPLHRSRDGGKTWERVHTWNVVQDFGEVEQSTLVIHPVDDNILFSALMGQGIAKSTDGGETWWLSTDGICATFVTNLVTDPRDPDTLYASGGDGSGTWKSTDGGETWTVLNKNGISHPWVDELTIDPSNPDVLYDIADVGLIFKTEDAGESWATINDGFHFSSVYALEVDPTSPSVVYAANNGFGVFKAENMGEWWQYLLCSPDYTYSLAIDPEGTGIVYSGYNRKVFENSTYIFRSSDNGDTWGIVHEIEGFEAVTSVGVDAQDSRRVYAGVTGERGLILASDDRGDTWSNVTGDFLFSTIHAQDQMAVDPGNPERIYASPWGAGLYVSEDAGVTWSMMDTPTISISCITIDETDPKVICIADRTSPALYRSIDGGATWDEFFNAGPMYSRLNTVKIDPCNPDIVWVAAFQHNAVLGSLFRIEDGVPVDVTGILPRSIIDIEIDPEHQGTVYVSLHGENIYKTIDGGVNWELLDMPITGVFDVSLSPGEPETVYAGTMEGRTCPPELLYSDIFPPVEADQIGGGGVYKSTDGGTTWRNVNQGEINSDTMALAVHPTKFAVVYAATSEGVYLSTDAGDSWIQQNEGLGFTDVGALSITNDRLYAGTRGGGVYCGLIAEATYEITWIPTSGPVPEISNIQVQVDPTDSDIIYLSSYPGGMYKSTDRGITWRDMNFFLPSFQVIDPIRQGYYKFVLDPNNPEKLYFAVSGVGVFASNDGGDSQFPLFGDENEMRGINATNIAVNPVDSSQIFVSSTTGVYRTIDGGRSWGTVNDGFVVADIMTLAFDSWGNLYAGSKGYGVYLLGYNEDTWRNLEPVQQFGVTWDVWDRPLYLYNALLINPFDGDIMYLGTFPTGFFRTTDGGVTWKEKNTNFTIDGAFAMTFHPYNKRTILAGTYNGVSKTEDAGETWVRWDNGMPPELWVFSLVYDPLNPEIIYAAAKNGQNKGTGREGYRGTVLKTLDGGRNWFEITEGLDVNQEYYQLVMYPYNYDVIFLSGSQGVYMTRDGGDSWDPIIDGLLVSDELVIHSGIVNNVANNLALSSDAESLYLGTQARGVYKADLSLLNLEHSSDALPLTSFNYVQDGDETGVDTGGSCVPGDGEYDYGLVYDQKVPDYTDIDTETNSMIISPITEKPPEDLNVTSPIIEGTTDDESMTETMPDEPDQGFLSKVPGFNSIQIIIGLLVVSFFFYDHTARNVDRGPQ